MKNETIHTVCLFNVHCTIKRLAMHKWKSLSLKNFLLIPLIYSLCTVQSNHQQSTVWNNVQCFNMKLLRIYKHSAQWCPTWSNHVVSWSDLCFLNWNSPCIQFCILNLFIWKLQKQERCSCFKCIYIYIALRAVLHVISILPTWKSILLLNLTCLGLLWTET